MGVEIVYEPEIFDVEYCLSSLLRLKKSADLWRAWKTGYYMTFLRYEIQPN
jgi:hypothetical protein